MAKVAVGEEDVVVALMVGEEDVAFVFFDVLTPLDLDLEQEEPEGALGPELGEVVGNECGVAQEAGDDDAGGYDDGDDDEDG